MRRITEKFRNRVPMNTQPEAGEAFRLPFLLRKRDGKPVPYVGAMIGDYTGASAGSPVRFFWAAESISLMRLSWLTSEAPGS